MIKNRHSERIGMTVYLSTKFSTAHGPGKETFILSSAFPRDSFSLLLPDLRTCVYSFPTCVSNVHKLTVLTFLYLLLIPKTQFRCCCLPKIFVDVPLV